MWKRLDYIILYCVLCNLVYRHRYRLSPKKNYSDWNAKSRRHLSMAVCTLLPTNSCSEQIPLPKASLLVSTGALPVVQDTVASCKLVFDGLVHMFNSATLSKSDDNDWSIITGHYGSLIGWLNLTEAGQRRNSQWFSGQTKIAGCIRWIISFKWTVDCSCLMVLVSVLVLLIFYHYPLLSDRGNEHCPAVKFEKMKVKVYNMKCKHCKGQWCQWWTLPLLEEDQDC